VAKADQPLADRAWVDPRHWLIEALQAEGKPLDDLDRMLPAPQQTRRAQAVADLAAYEKARGVLVRLVKDGSQALLPALACLYLDEATLHDHMGDHAVAVRLRDQVIKVYQHLVEARGDRELAGELARAFESKAAGALLRGQGPEAVALYGQARSTRERHRQGDTEDAELAALDAKTAAALAVATDWAGSGKAAERAIAGLTREGEQPKRDVLAANLATAYTTRGRVFCERGEYRGAVADAEAALALWSRRTRRRARSEEARRETAEHLRQAFTAQDRLHPKTEWAQGLLTVASIASSLALGPVAIFAGMGATTLAGVAINVLVGNRSRQQHLKEALQSLGHLVAQGGHVDLAGDLVRVYKRLAVENLHGGNLQGAGQLLAAGAALLQVSLLQEGRHALAARLAAARTKDGAPGTPLGLRLEARPPTDVQRTEDRAPGTPTAGATIILGPIFTLEGLDRSIEDYDYLIRGQDLTDLAAGTARAHFVRARALAGRGEPHAALEACEQSLSIWEQLEGAEGRREFASDRAEACVAAAKICAALQDQARARSYGESAVALYRALIEQGGRGELAVRLEEARRWLVTSTRRND
jgi:tetratricopeptide (TPR) repeat protein